MTAASQQLIWSLVWANIIVFIAGGVASYLFARRTLKPIEEAHEAQSRFTSDASHELRTPLAVMKAELEVSLQDPDMTSQEARGILVSNLEEVNKLISLSETLLMLSRLNSLSDLPKEHVDVSKLAAERIEAHKLTNRAQLHTKKHAMTRLNNDAIREVFDILLDNAVKYSPKNSPIVVKVFGKRGSIGVSIQNQGKIIKEHDLPHIFDRFYRADSSRTAGNKRGYGLGLSIAKKIIDIHEGSIHAKSDESGTILTFFIPS